MGKSWDNFKPSWRAKPIQKPEKTEKPIQKKSQSSRPNCMKIIYGESQYYHQSINKNQKPFNSDYQLNAKKALQSFLTNFNQNYQPNEGLSQKQILQLREGFKNYLFLQKCAEELLDCKQVNTLYKQLSKQYIAKYQTKFQAIYRADQQLNLQGWVIDFLFKWKQHRFSDITLNQFQSEYNDIDQRLKSIKQLIEGSKFINVLWKIYYDLHNYDWLSYQQIEDFLSSKYSKIFSEKFLFQTHFQKKLIQPFLKYKNKYDNNQFKFRCLIIIFLEHRLFKINNNIARNILIQSIFQMVNKNSSFFKACFDTMHKPDSRYFANLKMIRRIMTAISYHRNYFSCLQSSNDWIKVNQQNNQITTQISSKISQNSILNPKDYYQCKEISGYLNLTFNDNFGTTDLSVQAKLILNGNNPPVSIKSNWDKLFIQKQNTGLFTAYKRWRVKKQSIWRPKNSSIQPQHYPLYKFIFLIEQIQTPVAFILFYMSKFCYDSNQYMNPQYFPVARLNFQRFHRHVKAEVNRHLNQQNKIKIPYLDLKFNIFRRQYFQIRQRMCQILDQIKCLCIKLCQQRMKQWGQKSLINDSFMIETLKLFLNHITTISQTP